MAPARHIHDRRNCRKIPITLTENCLRSKERTPRVTVFPNIWDKLGMAAIDCKKVHQQDPRSALTEDHHSATLLIARRLIEQGFHDALAVGRDGRPTERDRKSTRLNSSHRCISYAVFCLK